MKKQIRKQAGNKLKSETGASILIALLVFLIAAMTGSVILTSATVSDGAVNRTVKTEQDMDVLKSAANVLIEELEKPVKLSGDGIEDYTSNNEDLTSLSELQTYLGQEVSKTGNEAKYTINTMKVTGLSDPNVNDKSNPSVKADITMDTDYCINITLTANNSHLYVTFKEGILGFADDGSVDEIGQQDAVISTSKGAE